MLYVLRLSGGDCIVTAAEDERSALACTLKLADGETVMSIRPLSGFTVRFSPTDSGSLEVSSWDDFSLDDILAKEYPILNEAFRRANFGAIYAAAKLGRAPFCAAQRSPRAEHPDHREWS